MDKDMQKQPVDSNRSSRCFDWLRTFFYNEAGVVTVEWVAIAAAMTVGAVAITFIVMQGLVAPAHHIASQLTP
jgi:hypothetical protein